MNRSEFLRQLAALLGGISEKEREEALQYYNDYFDDAGEENEADVLAALGTPAKVAENIKKDLSGRADDRYEYTDRGFQSSGGQRGNEVAVRTQYQDGRIPYEEKTTKKNMSPVAIILLILGIVLLFPLWVPLVAVAFGLLVAAISVVVALLIAAVAVGAALLVSGIAVFCFGIAKIFLVPTAALCLLGGGMVLSAVGILFLLVTIWLLAIALPAMFRGIVYLFRLPFKKKEEKAA